MLINNSIYKLTKMDFMKKYDDEQIETTKTQYDADPTPELYYEKDLGVKLV
jgi:hypothetical protein